jgi:hypothetical protein
LLLRARVLGNVEHVRRRGLVRVPASPEGIDERRIARRGGEYAYLGLGVVGPHEHAALWGAAVGLDLTSVDENRERPESIGGITLVIVGE